MILGRADIGNNQLTGVNVSWQRCVHVNVFLPSAPLGLCADDKFVLKDKILAKKILFKKLFDGLLRRQILQMVMGTRRAWPIRGCHRKYWDCSWPHQRLHHSRAHGKVDWTFLWFRCRKMTQSTKCKRRKTFLRKAGFVRVQTSLKRIHVLSFSISKKNRLRTFQFWAFNKFW